MPITTIVIPMIWIFFCIKTRITIALHESVNWVQAISDARQKEAGIELTYIGEILKGIPQSEFETIVWTKKPDWKVFRDDIDRIVYEMLSGETV